MAVNQNNAFRYILDTGLGVMAIGALIAWGASQAEQERLIKDVEKLQEERDAVIRLRSDFDNYRQHNKSQLDRIEEMVRSIKIAPPRLPHE